MTGAANPFTVALANRALAEREQAIDACQRWAAAEMIGRLAARFVDTDDPVEGLDDLEAALGADMVGRADLAHAVDVLRLPSSPPWCARTLDDR